MDFVDRNMIHPQWMEIGVNGDHGVYAIIVRRLEQDDVTTHQLVAGVHHVLGLQLSNRIVVIQMENGVNGDHGVLAMMGRRLEQENALEVHLVLGLQLRQMTTVQKIVVDVAPCIVQYVELMERLIQIFAWLNAGGFLWSVPADVLVFQAAGLPVNVSRMVCHVLAWIGAAVSVAMGGVNGTDNGVTGENGVPAMMGRG